jgi:hypothetical protein
MTKITTSRRASKPSNVWGAVLALLCMTPLAASAQTPALSSEAPTAMTPAEVKAAYQSCPVGYYSGPRPGKSRYTKDDYLWVVTPEFAAAYCMPSEFIDKTLKGAEAIAYKLVYEGAENCGFGGNKEACGRRTAHGFEIYYKSNLQLPSVSSTKYNYAGFWMIPTSKHLLSSHKIRTPAEAVAWQKERPGAETHFRGWGLVGVKGPKPVWPITALREIQYIEELLPGYNYLSVEGSMGYFSNPRYEKLGVTQFVLRLDKPGDTRDDEQKDLRSDYGHVIHLPELFIAKIRQVDKQGDQAFRELLKQALPEAFRKAAPQ